MEKFVRRFVVCFLLCILSGILIKEEEVPYLRWLAADLPPETGWIPGQFMWDLWWMK
jgi:hypothetical protein